jgi:hypothetical protein
MKSRHCARAKLIVGLGAAAWLASAVPESALAQDEGGLYIAGSGFSFEQAANRGLAQNPKGQRFFVLALPPNATALTRAAPKSAAAVREPWIEITAVRTNVCQYSGSSTNVRYWFKLNS